MNRFAGVLTTGAALAGLASMFAVLGGCGDDVTPLGERGQARVAAERAGVPRGATGAAGGGAAGAAGCPDAAREGRARQHAQRAGAGNRGGPRLSRDVRGAGVRLWPRDVHGRARTRRLGQVGREAAGQPGERGLAVRARDGKQFSRRVRTAARRPATFPGSPGSGSPSAADVGYQPRCSYLREVDLQKLYPDAPRLRIGGFRDVPDQQHESLALPRPDQGLPRERTGGRLLGPRVRDLQQPGDRRRRLRSRAVRAERRPRPVADRLRRHAGHARQAGCAAGPEQLRPALAARQRREGGRNAVLVLPDVPGLAAVRGGRIPVRSRHAHRHDADAECARVADRRGQARVPVVAREHARGVADLPGPRRRPPCASPP